MARNLAGIDTHNAANGLCMVVGCARKALFVNPNKRNPTLRGGYCRVHRDLAVPSSQMHMKRAADKLSELE